MPGGRDHIYGGSRAPGRSYGLRIVLPSWPGLFRQSISFEAPQRSATPGLSYTAALSAAQATPDPRHPRSRQSMSPNASADDQHDDIMYPSALPFLLVHLGCVAAIWTGVTWQAIAICASLYVVRMFAIGAGYHRYFSHRAFATGRVFQFILAWLAQSTAQKSVLWWAAKHRHHHLHSDTEDDVHSPRHRGFLYSHLGWIFYREHDGTDL